MAAGGITFKILLLIWAIWVHIFKRSRRLTDKGITCLDVGFFVCFFILMGDWCYFNLLGFWSLRAVASAVRCVFITAPKATWTTPRCSPIAWPTTSGTKSPWPSAPPTSFYTSTATGKSFGICRPGLTEIFVLELFHSLSCCSHKLSDVKVKWKTGNCEINDTWFFNLNCDFYVWNVHTINHWRNHFASDRNNSLLC